MPGDIEQKKTMQEFINEINANPDEISRNNAIKRFARSLLIHIDIIDARAILACITNFEDQNRDIFLAFLDHDLLNKLNDKDSIITFLTLLSPINAIIYILCKFYPANQIIISANISEILNLPHIATIITTEHRDNFANYLSHPNPKFQQLLYTLYQLPDQDLYSSIEVDSQDDKEEDFENLSQRYKLGFVKNTIRSEDLSVITTGLDLQILIYLFPERHRIELIELLLEKMSREQLQGLILDIGNLYEISQSIPSGLRKDLLPKILAQANVKDQSIQSASSAVNTIWSYVNGAVTYLTDTVQPFITDRVVPFAKTTVFPVIKSTMTTLWDNRGPIADGVLLRENPLLLCFKLAGQALITKAQSSKAIAGDVSQAASTPGASAPPPPSP